MRGNLIHDTQWNAFGRGEVVSGILDTIPCHGLYLDGNNTGCRYECNVVYRNAGGPLLFNSHKSRNEWVDNLFQKDGSPPREFIETMREWTGLEPAYQQSILNQQPSPCYVHALTETNRADLWSAYQFDLPACGRGVVQIVRRESGEDETHYLKLRGAQPSGQYQLQAYAGTLASADERFYEGTFFGTCDTNLFRTYLAALGDLPILSDVVSVPMEVTPQVSGRDLVERGLPVKLGPKPRVLWIGYQRLQP